jgi:uncharacterized delta-60 repeat protein
MRSRVLLPTLAAVALVIGTALPASAAAGDLDPTFGSGGKVSTFVGSTPAEANAVAIQADGKIVAAGGTDVREGLQGDFVLTRYNTDGSLDPTFGDHGIVITSFTPNDDHSFGVAIQEDGKIVAVGYSGDGTGNLSDIKLTLARYRADGTLDTTFGDAGKVRTDVGPCDDYALGVVIQPDGKIVTGGIAFFGTECDNGEFAVARCNTNGTLDHSFGKNGTVTTDPTPGSDFAFATALQPDGKIVVSGPSGLGGPDPTFGLARYNSDGSLDRAFGKQGKVTTNFTPFVDWANGLAIQGDGKIVAAGFSGAGSGNEAWALARYNTDGSLDGTFGAGGKVTTDFSSSDDEGRDVAIQADGKIVVVGDSQQGNRSMISFALARYTTNGSLDPTFGTGGKVLTDFTPQQDSAAGVAIQADGKIVAAGIAKTGEATNHSVIAVARYLAS